MTVSTEVFTGASEKKNQCHTALSLQSLASHSADVNAHLARWLADRSRKIATDRILFVLAREKAAARLCESQREVREWLHPF